VAVLLDLHSMPPLASASAAACGPRTGRGPRIVIGDRFGGSAGARFVARVESAVASERTAINVPYAGGYILERHGAPARGVHAVQLELDRTLYLDSALDRPGPGLGHAARLVAGAIAALEDEAMGLPSLAAE
jgi:N-formylglutamate amidohydrolase